MPNFLLLSRCENLWPFLTLRAPTIGAFCAHTSQKQETHHLFTVRRDRRENEQRMHVDQQYIQRYAHIRTHDAHTTHTRRTHARATHAHT